MQKKKFDLTTDIVEVAGGKEEVEAAKNNALIRNDEKTPKEVVTVLMGIQVEEDMRADYKAWCARHKMKMNEAFIKGFKLLKEKYGR